MEKYRGMPVGVAHSCNTLNETSPEKFNGGSNRSSSSSSSSSSSNGRVLGRNDQNSHSEISSCNYPAREKGVKNGMFLGNAMKLCPGLVVLPYDFQAYDKVSRKVGYF